VVKGGVEGVVEGRVVVVHRVLRLNAGGRVTLSRIVLIIVLIMIVLQILLIVPALVLVGRVAS